MVLYNNFEYTNYSAVAWVVDKRCNDNCRIKTFDSESYDEIIKWASKQKKCYGDSIRIIDRIGNSEKAYMLREDQIAFP